MESTSLRLDRKQPALGAGDGGAPGELGSLWKLKGDNPLVDSEGDNEETSASELGKDNSVDNVYMNESALAPLSRYVGVQAKTTPKSSGYTNVQPAYSRPAVNTSDTDCTNTQHEPKNVAKSTPSDSVYANMESEEHSPQREAIGADDVGSVSFTSQDDDKTRHGYGVYNNVPPPSKEEGEGERKKAAETEEEYNSLQLIRQQQNADPTYHHLTEV